MASSRVSRKIRRTVGVSLAAVGLAAAANLGAAAPGNASAAISCSGWGHGNYDAGEGYSKGTYALKTGPYAACGNISGGQTYSGTHLYYHCYVINDYGNSWTYARIDGSSAAGWFSDDNLDDGGATAPC
ncbi:SH3 domain-containing protein [Streptomyces sp. WI04-05B]|uniref:SH3 domain-containing protein n=1 Tax=Streptomyces TaxID=1883 RepID=UPI0029A99EFB|nr:MULTISPECIES: SH3 domain-containing protein [unclassified Streptomyces]MDX2546090.1 SH3 domain-containing protein [Streptomyces sp. WI04-05B]MDX2587220.1 SH3 domain-containing protein [Streptomyces sp. WI04-05A]MDX3752628.1 SH3 domain-containing protein [Streptomyces sp. AK08-02]